MTIVTIESGLSPVIPNLFRNLIGIKFIEILNQV